MVKRTASVARLGLFFRSRYKASCFRTNRFSAASALRERSPVLNTVSTGGRYCASLQFFKEAILSPVVSGTAWGKAEIVFVQSGTEIQQQFSVRIERALANISYRILVDISSGEPVDSGQQLDFGFVETDGQSE